MSLSLATIEPAIQLEISSDARIFPFMRPLPRKSPGEKQKWIHGIETKEDIDPIFLDQHRENIATVDYSEREIFLENKLENGFEIPRIKGKWMYGGILYDHFGHVLSESVQRLWCWRHIVNEVEGIIFLTSGPKEIDGFGGYLNELFDLWNIDKSKIKIVREVTDVDRLYLPKPGGSIGSPQEEWYESELEALTPPSLFKDNKFPEKIVFSRKNFLTSGKIIGFSSVEKLLEDAGYRIISPEDCSLTEQIKLIVNARNIVWEEGSNIHVLDILPRQNLDAFVFKRRRGLATFDVVLNRKVKSLNNFDLTKQISSVHVKSEKDINEKNLEGVAVNRMSLCVVSRLHHLRKFLVDELNMDLMAKSNEFKKFTYNYFSQEIKDIESYVNKQSVVLEEEDRLELLNHLRVQYTFVRATDKEIKDGISDL